ncbi:MAG: hypothetical protein F6K23_29320 [Okeania sp. SIO2C9]|uniref:hypothetical protein n=1 Tax=Okeania sp. SIO2C9 TaxID=2607791 RepID=UPI0013BF3110|nr:hypothetical protein [Okeania sp. SIO2C9]NEQ76763.1 hypothetical protein [Okeania sp. SIO2C9]
MPTETTQASLLDQLKNLVQKLTSKKPVERDANGEVLLDSFMEAMAKKYKQNFVKKVRQYTNEPISKNQADEYFRVLVKSLYENRIKGIGTYGQFNEAGAAGEKGRQDLVEAFHTEISDFIQNFGPVAAQGQTLLWSSYGIGRFAVDDKDILRSAGVTDQAQPLDQTKIGKLWDKLKITTKTYPAIGYTWDVQYNIWTSVSKEIAANAEGDVEVFLPKNISSMSIFWNVELPELRQRMEQFTDDAKVNKITIHRLTNDALTRVNKAKNNNAKKRVMLEQGSWEALDFSEATLEVPQFSERQQKLLEDSNPILYEQIDNYVKYSGETGEITIQKLRNIARAWKQKSQASSGIDTQLYQEIARNLGHIDGIAPSLVNNIKQGIATDNQIKQNAELLVAAFLDKIHIREEEPQDYNDSDIEIITRLLYDNYTRLQTPSSIDIPTKIVSKGEIENLLKKVSGDPTLATGFSSFNDYSKKLSAEETIEQFGLDYRYQNDSAEIVKPSVIYYISTPMTDDIKSNAKIPLIQEVKTKLQAIADDTTKSEDLRNMAKELTTPGVYHEFTPNTANNLPKYGTQADGKNSYAGMLLTTYSDSNSQLSPGATIRAKGPDGEDFKIADWDGLTWNVSPEDLPDWIAIQGRPEDQLNVDTLKLWKAEGDRQITPPTNVPEPVRAFMAHHFQINLSDITIQKVNATDNDDSTATSIKFKPGEYNDTTEEGLQKIAEKLGDALKLKVYNNGNQPDTSKAITAINNELPTKSLSIKNDLIMLRRPKVSYADRANAPTKFKPKYTTGRTPSVSPGRRPTSRR